MFFDLGYGAHGGSGLRYPLDMVLEMPMPEILWYTQRLEDVRAEEAKAIKRAYGKK